MRVSNDNTGSVVVYIIGAALRCILTKRGLRHKSVRKEGALAFGSPIIKRARVARVDAAPKVLRIAFGESCDGNVICFER